MKQIIFIGQAMPRFKSDLHDWPSLNKWIYSIGITDSEIKKYFCYSALVDYFPGIKNGSHRVPTTVEIEKEKNRLKKTIEKFNPEIIVPVGKLSISNCILQKITNLSDFIGKTFYQDPYNLLNTKKVIIPLPHPSGASVWKNKPENRRLLHKALSEIKKAFYE